MVEIGTLRENYKIPFGIDYKCNFDIYHCSDGDVIFRFHRDDSKSPWDSSINRKTIFAWSNKHGIWYREPSLPYKINAIFLDIIDMIQSDFLKMKGYDKYHAYDESVRAVFSDKIIKYMRESKLRNLVE